MSFFNGQDCIQITEQSNRTCQIFIQHFFKIVLYWCLDLICHNIGTPLKHDKYIFDIPIPFCHPPGNTSFLVMNTYFHFALAMNVCTEGVGKILRTSVWTNLTIVEAKVVWAGICHDVRTQLKITTGSLFRSPDSSSLLWTV
jgi:hypothetical protein